MKILVTGGTGYIGSHTVVELINVGYEVIIVDNLCNSSIDIIDKIEKITGKRCKRITRGRERIRRTNQRKIQSR